MESVNDASMEQQQPNPEPVSESAAQKAKERMERWKALQGRAVCAATSRVVGSSSLANLVPKQKKSAEVNRKEVYAERRRQSVDPSETARLNRRRAEAEFKLAKADAEDDGEDFERKRAWDWTVEESERWDKRVDKKKKHVEDVAFQGMSYASLGNIWVR